MASTEGQIYKTNDYEIKNFVLLHLPKQRHPKVPLFLRQRDHSHSIVAGGLELTS